MTLQPAVPKLDGARPIAARARVVVRALCYAPSNLMPHSQSHSLLRVDAIYRGAYPPFIAARRPLVNEGGRAMVSIRFVIV